MRVRELIGGGQIYYCPGCKGTHSLNISKTSKPSWTYNGNPERPTFTPSVLVTCHWSEHDPTMTDFTCHAFIVDGIIQFLGDCSHELAGKFVSMPYWPYETGKYGGIKE